jgi:predicted nucleic acid-binding protein
VPRLHLTLRAADGDVAGWRGPAEHLTPAIEDRAVEVLTLPAGRSQHRAPPSIPGLIIAATADLAGLTVLHLDEGSEVMTQVTGQPVERLSIGQ